MLSHKFSWRRYCSHEHRHNYCLSARWVSCILLDAYVSRSFQQILIDWSIDHLLSFHRFFYSLLSFILRAREPLPRRLQHVHMLRRRADLFLSSVHHRWNAPRGTSELHWPALWLLWSVRTHVCRKWKNIPKCLSSRVSEMLLWFPIHPLLLPTVLHL